MKILRSRYTGGTLGPLILFSILNQPKERIKLMRTRLEQYFGFATHATTWRTEVLAGLTTFVTMAYIIFVNPAILSQTGMPLAAVTTATCLCAAFGSILMGALANYPLALAPGMGLNAYFTYTVVKGMGVPWQTALGAVFLSGVIFLLLTFGGIRQRLLAAIPHQLHSAVAGGIGLFIAFIGLVNAGIIVKSPATTVGLGNLHAHTTQLAIFGTLLIAILQAYRLKAAILIGVLATLALGITFHQVQWQPSQFNPMAITQTAFHLDLRGALKLSAFEIIFVFLFVDLFDNLGTLIAVTERAGLIAPDGTIPRLDKIFIADATATIVGSLAGTSTVTSYIESSAGVAAGGRTGVTAIVTGLLFLLAMFVAPHRRRPARFCHRSRPHPGRCPHDRRHHPHRVERTSLRHPQFPHHHHHPAHLLHRHGPVVRPYQLRPPRARHRQRQPPPLDALHPRRPVPGSLHLHHLTGS